MSAESVLRARPSPRNGRHATAVAGVVTALVVFATAAPPSAFPQTSMPRAVVASGGGTASPSPLLVRTTVGQPLAGAATAAGHTVRAGFWIPGTGNPVGVEPAPSAYPARFALHPGRPNPFRGSTVLRYDVPAGGGSVRLEVFDLRGRRMATLLDGVAPPGEWEIAWNGVDDRGARAAAGIYLAVLRTPAGVLSRKLTLLR